MGFKIYSPNYIFLLLVKGTTEVKGFINKKVFILSTMVFDTCEISFSASDKLRNIKLPKNLDKNLCELIGIVLGDGSIYLKEKKRYEIHIYGDFYEDNEYHQQIVFSLFHSLFNITPSMRRVKNTNTLVSTIRSKAIVLFFKDILKIPPGKKNDTIQVPKYIYPSKEFAYSFLRGLADTDFTLRFKKNHHPKNCYPIIAGNFVSKRFVNQIGELFNFLDFNHHFEYNKTKYDLRYNKTYTSHGIVLSGKKNLMKWMHLIGFNNKRQKYKYLIWERNGFYPPKLSYSEKLKMVGELF